MDKRVFCKYLVDILPDALQLRAADAGLWLLGQGAKLIAVVQIQPMNLGFSKEYLEENLENAFSYIAILGAIPFRYVLPRRVLQLIQPWSI